MKKLILFILAAFLFAQCSATTTKRSTGETIDDKVIVVKLRTKYINDKAVKSSQIKIKSWKGVITLSGVLDNQIAINRAIEIAEQQNGVKEVKAYLVLKDSGTVSDPFVESSTSSAVEITGTTQTVKTPSPEQTPKTLPSTATTTATASSKTKKSPKKNQDREVIETDLMDNSVTTPNVNSTTQPTIESTTDFEEVKY